MAARQYANGVRARFDCTVAEVTLDVVWDADTATVRREIARLRNRWPGEVIEWTAFGQGRDNTMESRARNERRPVADNRGRIPGTSGEGGEHGMPGMLNDPAGPAVLECDTADAARIAAGWEARGINARLSEDAGGFLCESLLYMLLSGQAAGMIRYGRFFHLSATEGMAENDPERQRIAQERRRFVETLVELVPESR